MTNRVRIAAIILTFAGALAAIIAVGELAGSPGASATRPRAGPGAQAAAARVFSSWLYGYTVALPAGWSAQPGPRWVGAPGPADIFRGLPYVVAWAFAVPRPASPAEYATAITQTTAQLPCPAAPQTSQAITIAGVPARLIGMRCPARGGVLMLTAVTTRGPSALVVTLEDTSGMPSAERADRAAFREFLAGIRLPA